MMKPIFLELCELRVEYRDSCKNFVRTDSIIIQGRFELLLFFLWNLFFKWSRSPWLAPDRGHRRLIYKDRFNISLAKFPVELQSMREKIDADSTLDSFAYGTCYVPYEAQPITRASHLPLALQQIARRRRTSHWRAWSTKSRLWFIEAVTQSTVGSGNVKLDMLFYSRDGAPAAAGIWLRDAAFRWWLQRVLEPEEFHVHRLNASLPARRQRPKRSSRLAGALWAKARRGKLAPSMISSST